MANNFEYKIHVSIDQNSIKDDVRQALSNMAKEVKNNAFQIELTGNPKDLIKQLVDLKKQIPSLDLTEGLQFDLANVLKDNTEQGKKIISEFATYIIDSVNESINSIDGISKSIENTKSIIDELRARRKELLKDDNTADVVTAFEKAQDRLAKASNKFADSKQNKGKLAAAEEMKRAYQDVLNYQTEAGKDMSDKTKQILSLFAQDAANVFKDADGKITTLSEHLKDVKVSSTYKDDLKSLELQILENENKLTQLKKDLESAQNPELKVKGKLADNFLGDLQTQLDEMAGLEVKVKPVVDKNVKLEVETQVDAKVIDSSSVSNGFSEVKEKKQEVKEISYKLEEVQERIDNIKPQKTQEEIRAEFEKTRNEVNQTVSSQEGYFESLYEKAKTTKLSYEEVIAVVSEAEKISSQFTKHNLELKDTDFAWADGDWEKYDIEFKGIKSDVDNFKQSLLDAYKLYKNVESVIKHNAGMYKGQYYDNSDLDNLRGIFQAIASYANELGIDINSVIESIPRMTKEFKELASDAVLQEEKISENNRQYDGESEELKNINSQLQERYRLLEKILTITTKDNVVKTVNIEDSLSGGILSDFTDKDFQYGNVQTIVENICKLLGIEIPSAAEKAKEAIDEATSTPPNVSGMDKIEEDSAAATRAWVEGLEEITNKAKDTGNELKEALRMSAKADAGSSLELLSEELKKVEQLTTENTSNPALDSIEKDAHESSEAVEDLGKKLANLFGADIGAVDVSRKTTYGIDEDGNEISSNSYKVKGENISATLNNEGKVVDITTDVLKGYTKAKEEAAEATRIQKQLEKEYEEQIKSQIKTFKEFEAEQKKYEASNNKEALEQYRKSYEELTKKVKEYVELRKETAKSGRLDEEVPDIQRLDDEIIQMTDDLERNPLFNQAFEDRALSGLNNIDKEVQSIRLDKIVANYKELASLETQRNTLSNRGVAEDSASIKYLDDRIAKIKEENSALQSLEYTEEQLVKIEQAMKASMQVIDKQQDIANASTKTYKDRLNSTRSALQKQAAGLTANGKLMKVYGDQVRALMEEIKKPDTTLERLGQIRNELNRISAEATAAGQSGKSFLQILKQRAGSLVAYLSTFVSFYRVIGYVKGSFNTIRELDTELVDLRKTTVMSTSELNQFYLKSNDVAKQLGVTTKEVIQQAAAWSRLGYNTKEAATEMAAMSSKFAAISPGMDVTTAQEGLVSIMKAWDIDVANVESEIMDKINILGKIMPKHTVMYGAI